MAGPAVARDAARPVAARAPAMPLRANRREILLGTAGCEVMLRCCFIGESLQLRTASQ
jgi:hypothetical protein